MRFFAFIGVIANIVAIAAAVFFFGGFYSVAGTQEEPGIVASALIYVRQASIDRHALDTPPIVLDDPAVVQAGARAFSARGCVNCPGGQGQIGRNFPRACIRVRPTSRRSRPGWSPGSYSGSSRTASI